LPITTYILIGGIIIPVYLLQNNVPGILILLNINLNLGKESNVEKA